MKTSKEYKDYLFQLEKQVEKSWKELGVKTKDRFDYAYNSGKKEGFEKGYLLKCLELDKRTLEGKKKELAGVKE